MAPKVESSSLFAHPSKIKGLQVINLQALLFFVTTVVTELIAGVGDMKAMKGDGGRVARREKLYLLVVALAFSLIYNYNSIIPLDGVPARIDNDYSMTLWNIWEVTESVLHFENPFVTNKIYYPIGANLTTHPLTSGFFPLAASVKLLSGNSQLYPLYTYHLAIWVSYALLLIFSYLFLRELGYSQIESFVPAFCLAFGNFALSHVWHLNILSGFFLPAAAYFLLRLYKNPSRSGAVCLSICFGSAIYFTEFSLFIYLSAVLFLGAHLLFKSSRASIRRAVDRLGISFALFSFGLFLAIIAPFAYFFLKSNVILPSPAEASAYSANLAGFLFPDPARNPIYNLTFFRHLNSLISMGMSGREIFLGYPFILLALLGLIALRNTPEVLPLLLISLLFLVFSLGPHLIVLNKTSELRLPFYYLMNAPIVKQLRTPVRLSFFVIFLGTVIAAEGTKVLNNIVTSRGARCAIMAIIVVILLCETKSPINRQNKFVFPSRIIHMIKKGSVVMLPINSSNDYTNMQYQIFHNQPISCGYLARRNIDEIMQRGELKKLNPKSDYVNNATGEMSEFLAITKRLGVKNIIIAKGSGYPSNFLQALSKSINIVRQ